MGDDLFNIFADGATYEGKVKHYDWQPMIRRPEYDVELYPLIIETLDEWPSPCQMCGAEHDTLDCPQ